MKKRAWRRREFLEGSVAAVAFVAGRRAAAARVRPIGANDRINIGMIGCGKRAEGHAYLLKGAADAGEKIAVVACCDIWKKRQETFPDLVKKLFVYRPEAYGDYRRVLERRDIDAVLIATPAHQHCGQLLDSVRAGKHVYVEKPIAPLAGDLPALKECYRVVSESKVVVQHGTQGSSHPATEAVKAFIASGKLGRLFRIESSISTYEPYWNFYDGPKKEEETDWRAFLYNKSYRPFDPDQEAAWMGYHDFSSGPIGGWMSHFSNFVHHATGCGCPTAAVAYGGIVAPTSDRRRTAPDNVTVVLEYSEGFITHFVTHFGNTIDNETTKFMFEKGTLRTRYGHWPGTPVWSGEGTPSEKEIPAEKLSIPEAPPHIHHANWLNCIREGKKPNAVMELGYKQGVAVIMGDMSHSLGRKVSYDAAKREVRPA